MEELIELLTQIQELAGVGIEALQQAAGGGEPAPAPEEAGEAAGEGAGMAPPPEGRPE